MNKYQEALDSLKDTKCDEINNCKQCSLTSYCGHYQCIKTLQELVDTVNLLKSKLYLPEENDCDTLDDGSKVYMIYSKGVWSEEEYKALKKVLNENN